MNQLTADQKTRWLYLFTGLAVLLNFSGLFVPVMGPDGALYASVAKYMAQHNNFTDLYAEGKDWLDKPHFPFWVTAVFFKIFGVNTWAYKLPGIGFMLLAAGYTYKFARSCYSRETALWAVIILLTAQHVLICTMDVRAEPFLTGLIMGSVYHFYRSLQPRWFMQLVLACLFAACAVMTKGIFALIPIGGAIGGHLLVTKNWKMILNFRWLLAMLLIFLFLTPELYSLYTQFDLHPEKVVFGRQQVSGIRFFFWDSQFGRFFNTGPIKKSNGDPSFFLHTILWAFLPWSVLFYTALYQFFRKNCRQPKAAEWYGICGSLLTLLVFSLSKFQLPFYIVIVFPFFAILCAQYWCGLVQEKSLRAIGILQLVVCGLMVAVTAVLHYFFRPGNLTWLTGLLLLLPVLVFAGISWKLPPGRYRVLLQSCCTVFLVNLYFNLVYYPKLLTYQSAGEAAFWINTHNSGHLPVVQSQLGFDYALDFYCKDPVYYLRPGEEHLLPAKPYLLYADQEVMDRLKLQGIPLQVLHTFPHYRITRVKGRFLNASTREQTLTTTAVVLVK